MTAWYGCLPDIKDHRDLLLARRSVPPPLQVDLFQWFPPVMDQGPIGSCTAHGVTTAARYHIIKRGTTYDFPMSRLQLYYDSRMIENSVLSDSGAQIRDVIKTLAQRGVGHEDLWPYDTSHWPSKPPREVYDDAVQYKALAYRRVSVNATALKLALASGNPVVVGISVYESFESASVEKTGMVPVPEHGEKLVGGHCMVVGGYGQRPGTFTVRNSWGDDWGDKGDCFIPEAYLGSDVYASDFWTLDLFGSNDELKAGTA